MKKTNGLSLGLLAIIVFTEIALMDYLFPGLDPDSRLRNINMKRCPYCTQKGIANCGLTR